MVQIERLDILNAKLAASADKEYQRRLVAERTLEGLREAMVTHFGIVMSVDLPEAGEERE